jgi:hypothetical protein
LHVAFLIASSESSPKHLQKILSMLPAVTHPVRSFLLRQAFIKLFPKGWELSASFAYENFREMLDLLPPFRELYPGAMQLASGWLAANISISLLEGSNPDLIAKFLRSAAQCEDGAIALAIAECVVHSIDPDSFDKFLPVLSDFFSGRPAGDDFLRLAVTCAEICDKPAAVFEFILRTPYSNACGFQITKIAVRRHDLDVLKKCAAEWQTDDVRQLLVESLHPNEFAEIGVALENGCSLTRTLIQKVDAETRLQSIRKCLSNELFDRAPDLDRLLIDLMCRFVVDREFIEIVFGEPFQFSGSELIQFVLAASFRLRLPFETNRSLLQRTSDFPGYFIALMNIYDHQRGDELVDTVIESPRPLDVQILLSKLVEFNVSEPTLERLLGKFSGPSEFCALALLAGSKNFRSLLQDSMVRYFRCESGAEFIQERLDLYFKGLNVIAGLCQTEDVFDGGFVGKILELIQSILEVTQNEMFPLLTAPSKEYYRMILAALQRAGGLAAVGDQIARLSEMLRGPV